MMKRLMKKSKWFVAVAAIGKICSITCCYFLAKAYLSKSPYTLDFPQDHDLIFRVDTEIVYDDSPAMGKSSAKRLKVEAIARGRSELLSSAARYRVLFDEFRLYNEQGWLILGFARGSDQAVSYSTDERFSDEERLGNYAAFNVDLAHSSSSDDLSLLQQPVDLVLGPEGRIQEISFAPLMRRQLLSALEGIRISHAIRELLNGPDKAPALFSDDRDEKWTTSGQWLQPMILEHHIAETQNDRIVVESVSHGSSSDVAANNWIQLQGKQVDKNDLSLRWTYDPQTRSLDSIDFQWQLALSNSFLNVPDSTRLEIQGSCRLSYELTPPRIARSELAASSN